MYGISLCGVFIRKNVLRLKPRNRGIARVIPLRFQGTGVSPFLFVLAALVLFSMSSFNPAILAPVRVKALDLVAPLLSIVNKPFYQASEYIRAISGIASLQAENEKLAQENARLREWYQTALSLRAENESLHKLLNIRIPPAHRFITARVIGDSGNAFAKSLLVLAGGDDGVEKGQAVLAGDGLIGRVIESGRKTAHVLLLTDMNSRIPVLIEGTDQRAIMGGNNDDTPVLLYLPPEAEMVEGARVITSGHDGILPYGLPVGTVIRNLAGQFAVMPYAEISRVTMARIIDRGEDPNLNRADSQSAF